MKRSLFTLLPKISKTALLVTSIVPKVLKIIGTAFSRLWFLRVNKIFSLSKVSYRKIKNKIKIKNNKGRICSRNPSYRLVREYPLNHFPTVPHHTPTKTSRTTVSTRYRATLVVLRFIQTHTLDHPHVLPQFFLFGLIFLVTIIFRST